MSPGARLALAAWITVAEPGANRILLLQGICVPLIPIGEEDVEP